MRDTAAGASTSAEIGWVGPGDKALSMRCELLHRNFNSWGLWSASSAALPIGTFQITATPWSAWYVKAWAFGHPGGGGIWIAINLLCVCVWGGRLPCFSWPYHSMRERVGWHFPQLSQIASTKNDVRSCPYDKCFRSAHEEPVRAEELLLWQFQNSLQDHRGPIIE